MDLLTQVLSGRSLRAVLFLFLCTGRPSLAHSWSGKRQAQVVPTLPDFVVRHAPLIWLHSEDPFHPSDIATQVQNTIPKINFTDIPEASNEWTLENLDELNSLGGESIYLTSKEGIQALPSWFDGVLPNGEGETEDAVTASVIIRDHGNGVVDAFYFFFYAYNEGRFLDFPFGLHVGDWEHIMIRFQSGDPREIWYSQHNSGQAFEFSVVNKHGDRPIGFSANGSHAIYPTAGTHPHTIPGCLLRDKCDEGVLWDPILSTYGFEYNEAAELFTPLSPNTPVNWLYFSGRWGDQQLPDDTPGQDNWFGQRKYTSGPTGPKFKSLNRERICPTHVWPCVVRKRLGPGCTDEGLGAYEGFSASF